MTNRLVPLVDLKKILLVVSCCFMPHFMFSISDTEIAEKKAKVAMRMIGHEILNCVGDYDSRVLPIEKSEDQYKISFESQSKLDPDDIASIVKRIMHETKTATNYIVEVVQCETSEMMHSFFVGPRFDVNAIPCGGRNLPKDCYYLLVTLFEDTPDVMLGKVSDSSSVGLAKRNDELDHYGLYLMLLFFMLLGGGLYYYKMKKGIAAPLDPNLLMVGSSHFDKRSLVLSYRDQKTELSHKEAELLSYLHSNKNEPIKREAILRNVWGDEGDYIGRTLDVFISKLRKKLEEDTSVKIVNIRGVGYKLVMEG